MIDAARIHHWLSTESRKHTEIGSLLAGLCAELMAAGMPLSRANLALHTLHPQVVGAGYTWRPGMTSIQPRWLLRGEYLTRRYLESPLPVLARDRAPIRRRLTGPHPALDFPILRDLLNEGVTDFAALPVVFTNDRVNALSLATRAPGGFLDSDITAVEEFLPFLSLALEVRESHRFAAVLLDTYLGRRTGEQVLRGQISRGDGRTIDAALWYCDLRDFTPMTTEQTPEQVIEWLNAYFEAVVGPVHAQGGEVLKFIGDAVLAIFAIESPAAAKDACRRALSAACSALADLAARSGERERAGKPPLRSGIALHVGEVVYGNIGAPDRLDFTVIGSAVNVVTRIAGLCAPLDQELLLSKAFAGYAGAPLISLGAHSLKGIAEPEALFTLAGG